MATPDISAILSTLPGSPTRGHVLWNKVVDEKLGQLVWKAEILVPREWEPPVAATGFFIELENNPRSSKEAMLIVKALAGVDLPPGVTTGVTGGIGSLGLDELEKSEGFADVIRLSSFVTNAFVAPAGTFTYKSESYTLQDFDLLHVDENNRKLVAIYIRAGRTFNEQKWFGNWGGTLGNIVRSYSTAPLTASTGLTVIDSQTRALKEGTYMSETFTASGSWSALTKKEVDQQQAIRTAVTQVVGAGTTTGSITSDNVTLTSVEVDPIDYLRELRITTTEAIVGPELTTIERSELDTERTTVSQIIAPATVVATGRAIVGANVVETSTRQVDKFHKEKVVATEPVASPLLDSEVFNQYDLQPIVTDKIVAYADRVSGASFNETTHLLTTNEYKKIDSLRVQQMSRVESLTGPELYDSTYNPELGNFSTVVKQVTARPDLYTSAPWTNSVTIGSTNIVVVERKDLDRWRTVKMTSTLDFTGLTAFGTSSGFYKTWAGYAEVDLPPEVSAVTYAEADSTSGTSADYAFNLGFAMKKTQRMYPAEFYRFYSTKPTQALLTAMINATSAVDTDFGAGTSKLLEYAVKTKDILIASAYWGSGSSVQNISTPNAFWASGISFSQTLAPTEHKVFVTPNTGTPFKTLSLATADFTSRPNVKKVVKIVPKEWFGSIWVTDVVVANLA